VIRGEVVCFPDDDCWYPDDVLRRVDQALKKNSHWHGIIGDSVDASGRTTLPWRDQEGKLTRPMSWRRAISYAIFLRSSIIAEIGGFDETLGVGANTPWGSGEDNDLVLRALKAGSYIEYDPNVHIHHPRLFPVFDKARCAKGYSYALGDGRLLRKHPMPLWWQSLFFAVPLCRAALALIKLHRKETYFHLLTFKGRLKGFVSAKVLRDQSSQRLVNTSVQTGAGKSAE
jgi:GT2 family glycosyltransferase